MIMKLRSLLVLAVFSAFVITAGLSNLFSINDNLIILEGGDNYKTEWAKVDSLDRLGLPKSAIVLVEKIYEKALQENNSDQILKATIYRMKYLNMYEEDAFENAVAELEKQVVKTEFPANAMMHSMLAEMYWMYYQNNRWKFYNRTETINFVTDDIKTWDLNKLADKVIKHYQQSLKDKEKLQKISIDVFDEVIVDYDITKKIRPTVYDFLAHRAINFYSNTELTLTHPADKFMLAEEFYFADAKDFINRNIQTSDTLALQFYGIKVLQDLLKFRLNDDNKEALISSDISRIHFVYYNSVSEIKDSLYLKSLKNLKNKFKNIPYSSEVSYLIAAYYNGKGNTYNATNKSTEKYKWYNKTAHEICVKTMEKFPKETGSLKCKSLRATIETHNLSAEIEDVVIPNNTFSAKITYKNLSKAYIRIAKIDYNKLKKLQEKLWGTKLIDRLLSESEVVDQKVVNLPYDNDFNSHSAEVLLDGISNGTYVLFISNTEKFTYNENMLAFDVFDVSNISYVSRQKKEGMYDFYVLNRKTGEPLSQVTVDQFVSKYDYKFRKYVRIKTATFITDENGYITIPKLDKKNYNNFYLTFKNGTDILHSENAFYSYDYNYKQEKHYATTIFTDRAIYRPGQTIYFKGITLEVNDKNKVIAENFSVTVTFYDVNYQKITELKLTTNEYGTFSGTFDIPLGLLNGNMQIQTPYGSKYISVEEYKRPKFEVKMLPFDGDYLLNDTVEIKGEAKAYSGAMLTDAIVNYRIVRTPNWRGWWSRYWGFSYSETEIENGTVQSDEKGQYIIKFKAVPDISMPKSDYLDFNYKIVVDVTDINGETQSTQSNIRVGYVALSLSTSIYDKINKNDKDTFDIYTTNLSGEYVNAKGSIKVFKLSDVDMPLRSRRWQKPDEYIYTEAEWKEKFPGNIYKDENNIHNLKREKEVFKTNFDTEKSKKLELTKLKNWEVGRYVIEMNSVDAFGNDIKNESFFTLYADETGKIPHNTIDLFSVIKSSGQPGEFAKFIIGSADKDVKVMYEIEHKDKIISKEWINLNNEQKLIEIGIKEEHRGNFSVHFTFIKENRFYTHSSTISVPYKNKELDIEFETFRNKLLPGENEEWRIKIKGPKGEKVAAEMLATLYDASLDEFRANSWNFNVFDSYYSSMYATGGRFGTSSSSLYKENFDDYYAMPYENYEYLNWFGFSYYGRSHYSYPSSGRNRGKNGGRDRAVMKSVMSPDAAMAGDYTETEKEYDMDEESTVREVSDITTSSTRQEAQGQGVKGHGKNNGGGDKGGLDNVKARSNFNETAFFFPHLMTNENSEVIISFTIPESLTKWKMMGMAHTKDLKLGFIQNELITQKELMVMPNAPRFFREGDKIEFPVKVSNLTEKDIDGQIRLELFDAITMKPVENIFAKGENAEKKFTVKLKQNALVVWNLEIPDGVQAISFKVVAKSGKHSDGEERALPVLTNRMLVTETMPLPVRGMQTKTFEFTKLINSGGSKTLKHHKVTLEFTSNPAWYAVQALPYLMEYPYECAEQIFSRYYANSLASHIANSSPKIKRVFDAWKNTPDSKALLSNLEKNQELKALLLEETPWVLNAQSETERKKRVGLLFDLNKMGNELNVAIRKLEKMQSSNGGWPWFTGMPESRYITQHIVTGMGHLDNLGVKNVKEEKSVWSMVKNGINYLDIRIKEDYNYLKRYYSAEEMKKKHIGYLQIQYLYARSYFTDVPIPKKTQEAFDYYKGQAKKYWLSESKYMQGMISLALHRYEEKKTAMDIVNSLRENSTNSEEMGMYWKDVVGYYWYQAPIERQALLIEVFDEVANDQKSVENLKVWLLKQKQTQDWKTTKATVEAVYALLLRGADWLDSDQLVEIKMGDMVIDPKKMDDVKIEAGTGYFKTSWGKGEITPQMGNVTVTKKDEGVAWGAVYWQYFEQLDKITTHETPLKLTKKLFIERNTDAGKVIEPIGDKAKLKVGDKIIVRIELRVDRSMEYVHMKDMRASGFEPINVISRYKYQDGLGYYESTKDAATNFFISYMPKGTYVFEYPLRVQHRGDFSNGITTIQCMYAPEFASHSEGIRVKVE